VIDQRCRGFVPNVASSPGAELPTCSSDRRAAGVPPPRDEVGPVMIVVVSPSPKGLAGKSERIEHFFIEAFVTELAIEAPHKAILLRLARHNEAPGDGGFVLSFEDGTTDPLTAIVRDDGFRPAIEPDAAIEFPVNTCA
jgi:hypothetical protein